MSKTFMLKFHMYFDVEIPICEQSTVFLNFYLIPETTIHL